MNQHQRPLGESPPAASPNHPGKWRWNWQLLAQGAWIVLAFLLLITFVANIPAFFQSSRTGCSLPNPTQCPTGLFTPGNVQALGQLHFSVTVAADFLATLTLAVSVLYWIFGLLIFWRKSQEWIGLFFSLVCIMLASIGLFGFVPSAQTPQFFQLVTGITIYTLSIVGPLFFIIFPTGRFTPRWTWAVFVLFLVTNLPFMPPAVSIVAYFLVVGVQVYRYIYIYDAVQQQQTKWFVFGFCVGISFLIIYNVLGALVPSLSAPDSGYQLFNALTWLLVWTLLLLSMSVAILRYRLWDIDVIINRTLVYSSLTVLLVALYVSLILTLQVLVRAVTGSLSQQPFATVVSTLVIAALFQPLRRSLQAIIDRRFYRRKYDAAKITAAFSSTLRNEVNLDQLREHLLAVVQETMQPSHVSLWVRQSGRAETPSIQIGKPLLEEASLHEEIIGHDG